MAWPVGIALPLLVALVASAEPPPERARSPWFLPRYAALGAYAGNGVFSPTARVGFELALIEQKTEFVFQLEGGLSWGVLRPIDVLETYQHTVMAGFGLRPSRSARWQWGVSAMSGPLVYGAKFTDRAKTEERVNGVVEGRAHFGINLGAVTPALYVGYEQPFFLNTRFAGVSFVGGVAFGVLVNWR